MDDPPHAETDLADVNLIELECVDSLALEWVSSFLGFLQRILGDLVLVAEEGNEHVGVSARTLLRASRRHHGEVCF